MNEPPTDQTPDGLPDAAYLAAFDGAGSGLVLTALDGRVLSANAAFRGRLHDIVGPDAPPEVAQPPVLPVPEADGQHTARLTLGSEISGGLQLLHKPDGTPGWWLLTLDPASAPDRLRDPLTGLADRRLLLERVALALTRRGAAENSVELVVLDVDDFKAINDDHGHVVGDAVLVEVAARLASCVRPADLVARWGGDEFVVLLEEGKALGGRMVCQRIDTALREPVDAGGATLQLQISCGWVRAEPDDDAIALLHRADVQMYEVKAAHRRSRRPETAARDEEHLHERLARAQERSVELRSVTTEVHARARLVMDSIRRRRDLADGAAGDAGAKPAAEVAPSRD